MKRCLQVLNADAHVRLHDKPQKTGSERHTHHVWHTQPHRDIQASWNADAHVHTLRPTILDHVIGSNPQQRRVPKCEV
jgi:hypothetical protein